MDLFLNASDRVAVKAGQALADLFKAGDVCRLYSRRPAERIHVLNVEDRRMTWSKEVRISSDGGMKVHLVMSKVDCWDAEPHESPGWQIAKAVVNSRRHNDDRSLVFGQHAVETIIRGYRTHPPMTFRRWEDTPEGIFDLFPEGKVIPGPDRGYPKFGCRARGIRQSLCDRLELELYDFERGNILKMAKAKRALAAPTLAPEEDIYGPTLGDRVLAQMRAGVLEVVDEDEVAPPCPVCGGNTSAYPEDPDYCRSCGGTGQDYRREEE